MTKKKGHRQEDGRSNSNSKTYQETLVDELTQVTNATEAKLKEEVTVGCTLKSLFCTLTTPVGEFISFGMLVGAYGVSKKVHYLVEGIVLLVLFFGSVAFYFWDFFLSRFFMVRRAKSHISAYINRGYKDSTRFATNPGEVAVKTSSTWRFTFSNLLIPGDQVLIPKGAHIPKGAVPSEAGITPTTTSTTNTNTNANTNTSKRMKHVWLRSYEIREAPGATQLDEAFSAQRPGTRLEREILCVRTAYAAAAWVFFFLAVGIGFIRYYGRGHDLAESVLAQPAYVFVGSSLVFLPYIPWAVIESYCNARLQSAFFMLQKRSYKEFNRLVRESTASSATSDDDSASDGTSPASFSSSSPSMSPAAPTAFSSSSSSHGRGRKNGCDRSRLHRLRSSMEFGDEDALPDPKNREEVDDAGRVRVPFKLLWKHFRVLLFDKSPCVMRSARAFQTLGSVTTCVFLNKDATLIEPLPQPECVYLPTPVPKGTRLSLSTHVSKDTCVNVTFDDTDWKKYIPVLKPLGLANLIYRPLCCPETDAVLSSHICMGEMPDLPAAVAAQAIRAGDSAAAAATATGARSKAASENRHWKEAFVLMSQNYSRPYLRCMCALSTEIGFSESVARHFKRVKEIHTYASIPQVMLQDVAPEVLSREPPYMMSVAIRYFEQQMGMPQSQRSNNNNNNGNNSRHNYSLQMFSKGNLFVVLGHCSSLWDGKRIVTLTPQIRNQIVAEYSKLSDSYNIVAFAYKPIQKQHAHIFDGEGTIMDVRVASVNKTTSGAKASTIDKRMVKDCIRLEDNEAGQAMSSSSSSSSEHDTKQKHRKVKGAATSTRKKEQGEGEHIASGGGGNDEDKKTAEEERKGKEAQKSRKEMEEIQTDQIFIGMTALRSIPKKGTSTVINSLDHAGIRFMYFSTEDEHRSVFMAQKLGLETDWNCLISLKDPVPPQSKYMDGPAKLPRGISNIRRHIAKVDPIPLRVPVFSDCTPESSSQMIQILQENGETVLCVGNCLEERSAQAFAQANIAIAMQPGPARCTQQGPQAVREDELLSSHTFVKHSSLGCLSADLTSLSCTFVMHQLTDFKTLGDLLCESRHLLGNTVQALLYAFSLVLVLGAASAVAACAFAPPVFNGYQMLWSSLVLIPILAACLVTGTLDDDIMSRLTPKSHLDPAYLWRIGSLITSQVIPSFCTCLLTFLFTLKNVWSAGWRPIFDPGAVGRDAPPEHALLYAQNFALLSYTLCALVSMFILARPGPSFSSFFSLLKLNKPQNTVKLLSIVIQGAFFVVSLAAVDGFDLFEKVSWQPWVIMAAGLLVSFVSGVLCLVKYKKWWNDYQLDLKLEFETKLGMYSPVAQSP